MNQWPAIQLAIFMYRSRMNPIPLIAAVLVKAILEWWFED